MNNVTLKIDNFEGPLDLLLHLIDKKELEIAKIKISQLIDEYLSFLSNLKRENLSIKVEFLIIASELLEIKALSILNMREREKREEELGKRLQEYKFYKDITVKIRELENEFNIPYTREEGKRIKKIPSQEFDLSKLSIIDIFKAYSNYIEENVRETLEINTDQKYYLQEEMEKIKEFSSEEKINLNKIFENAENKIHLVYILLAILELYKVNLIEIEGETLKVLK
ncbi:segregation and condensation protein A [Ilyobacter polytropus]|uniref:Segregation and condensation protein A n=1 Tax=Ilyobacter polytropus (strain ATCC 51220 / DSM 2926 / LMG 16218 / CuHBu1) TaxID=572544 RepID=E3H7S0_ILYPC|nr:segregation/condensation protein A [Ilyobacter polytropus]ADO82652.1 chromosome segregation and condensation protein ScpA [Ilyobacter polytropus DSM 2926]